MPDYIAVKLDAGLDANGNGRRGWRVYTDDPDPKDLGWVEEEHGRADSDSMYELCSAILDAEGVEHMARTGAASYPHDVHALINSGRVRVLCSMSVPYSEIREARRTPFKLGGA